MNGSSKIANSRLGGATNKIAADDETTADIKKMRARPMEAFRAVGVRYSAQRRGYRFPITDRAVMEEMVRVYMVREREGTRERVGGIGWGGPRYVAGACATHT